MEGKVVVYGSLPLKSLSEELNKQLRDLYGKDGKALDVTIPEVQKQSNQIDRGCFAIAWEVLLAIGEKQENITLNKTVCRKEYLSFPVHHQEQSQNAYKRSDVTLM